MFCAPLALSGPTEPPLPVGLPIRAESPKPEGVEDSGTAAAEADGVEDSGTAAADADGEEYSGTAAAEADGDEYSGAAAADADGAEDSGVSKRFADQSVSKRFRKQCRDAIAAGMDENVFTDWSKKYNRIQDVPKVKAETAKGYIEAESAAYELLIAALPQQARMELTGDDSNVRMHPFRMNEKVISLCSPSFFGALRC